MAIGSLLCLAMLRSLPVLPFHDRLCGTAISDALHRAVRGEMALIGVSSSMCCELWYTVYDRRILLKVRLGADVFSLFMRATARMCVVSTTAEWGRRAVDDSRNGQCSE